MDTLYTQEKFIQAIRALTLGPGAMKSRLAEAHRRFFVLEPGDFPEQLRADFEWICHNMTASPVLRARFSNSVISSDVSRTLHRMSNKTAVTIAERIVALNERLADINDKNCQQANDA